MGFVPVLVDLEGESVNEGSSGKFRQREGKPVGRKDEEPSLLWISNQRLRYLRTRYERGEIIFESEPEKEPEVPHRAEAPTAWVGDLFPALATIDSAAKLDAALTTGSPRRPTSRSRPESWSNTRGPVKAPLNIHVRENLGQSTAMGSGARLEVTLP